MKKILFLIGLIGLMACTKDLTRDHGISAEFPAQETLQSVSVSLGGSADIVISREGIVRHKSLALYYGPKSAGLLEETFWKEPALQWIFILTDPETDSEFAESGFVDVFKARGLASEEYILYASTNVYDKMSKLSASPLRFEVKVREDRK